MRTTLWSGFRRVSIGFLLGFLSGTAIWAAQRAGHPPPKMTVPGMLFMGGCGAVIGWLCFQFRDRPCPRCGHPMGKGDVYSTDPPTYTWLDYLVQWRGRSRRGVALYDCESCGAVYRMAGVALLDLVYQPDLVKDAEKPRTERSVNSRRAPTEEQIAPSPPTSSGNHRLLFLGHRVFWINVTLLFSGVCLVAVGVNMIRDGAASVHWPQAEGRVVVSEVVESEKKNKASDARIAYDYKVNDESFHGSRISFGSTDDRSAAQLTGYYPVGALVSVYYDADDPRRCVLEPGITFGGMAVPVLGSLLLCCIVCIPLWRSGWRNAAFAGVGLVGAFWWVMLITTATKSHATFVANQEAQRRKQEAAALQAYQAKVRHEQNQVMGTHWIDVTFNSSIKFNNDGSGEIVDGIAVDSGREATRAEMRYEQEDDLVTMVLESGGTIKADILVIQRNMMVFRKVQFEGRDANRFNEILKVGNFVQGEQ